MRKSQYPWVWQIFFKYNTEKYKEHLQLSGSKTNDPILKQAKELERYFNKEDTLMTNKHTKRHSILVIKETQIKTAMIYHYTPANVAKIKIIGHTMCWQGWVQVELLYMPGG